MTLKYLAERGLENPQMIAISEGVGSGSKLFQSLLQSPTGIFFGPAAASVVLGVIPAYVLTLFFQRYLVRGLSFGSVK